jgi:hypothetical protein
MTASNVVEKIVLPNETIEPRYYRPSQGETRANRRLLAFHFILEVIAQSIDR